MWYNFGLVERLELEFRNFDIEIGFWKCVLRKNKNYLMVLYLVYKEGTELEI